MPTLPLPAIDNLALLQASVDNRAGRLFQKPGGPEPGQGWYHFHQRHWRDRLRVKREFKPQGLKAPSPVGLRLWSRKGLTVTALQIQVYFAGQHLHYICDFCKRNLSPFSAQKFALQLFPDFYSHKFNPEIYHLGAILQKRISVLDLIYHLS